MLGAVSCRHMPRSGSVALIDSHCHIDDPRFDTDREAVLAQAAAAGVSRLVVPAIAADTFASLAQMCADTPQLHPAYGLHPLFLHRHEPADLEELPRWLADPRCVAVGECGLDYFVPELDRDVQMHYFAAQLELAKDMDLPVIVHARRAVEQVTLAIRRVGGLRGVIHSFAGSIEQARQLWELGFHLGFGGPITYPRARRLRAVVAQMPLEQLLIETDAPDQPLCGRQGRRNEPAQLVDVCQAIAHLRGVDAEEIASATRRNTALLFALP